MQPVLNVAEIREFEQSCYARGMEPFELMRRAGAVVALQAARLVSRGSAVVLCGSGNNGGDGWVAADNLAAHGYEVNVVCPCDPEDITSEVAARAAKNACEMGVPVYVEPTLEELVALLVNADVVIDAMFGIGFHGTIGQPFDVWISAVDDYFDGTVLSIDVPSGIDATTGWASGAYVAADYTVTMFALKPGLLAGLGRYAAGELIVASLVTQEEGLDLLAESTAAYVLSDTDYLDVLPDIDPLADKYERGHVLVVAGSSRYPGAGIMCALAAARSGAGYVSLAVPESVRTVCQAHLLSIPVIGLPCDETGAFSEGASEVIAELAGKADVVVAGCGMTRTDGTCEVVKNLLKVPVPLVLDADALNVLAKLSSGTLTNLAGLLRRDYPLVLTPHHRELARLCGCEVVQTASLFGSISAAQNLAWSVGSSNFAVVAKGAVSAVCTPESNLIPQPGPACLATAGTGDILAGLTAGFLAQKCVSCDDVCAIGSSELLLLLSATQRVHAIAAEIAQDRHGERAVIAEDLLETLGFATEEVIQRSVEAYEDQQVYETISEQVQASGQSAPLLPDYDPNSRNITQPLKPIIPGEVRAYDGDLDEPEPHDQDVTLEAAVVVLPCMQDSGLQTGASQTAQLSPVSEASCTAPVRVAPVIPADEVSGSEQGSEQNVPAFLTSIAQGFPADNDHNDPSYVDTLQDASEDVPQEVCDDVVPPAPADSLQEAPDDSMQESPADPLPEEFADAPAVPAFLSEHNLKKHPRTYDSLNPCATTILPALSLEELASAIRTVKERDEVDDAIQELDPAAALAPNPIADLSDRQRELLRLAQFHERATKRIGADRVTSPQDRPQARRNKRSK